MGKVLITASHFQTLCQEAIQLLESNGHSLILNDHELPYYSFEDLAYGPGKSMQLLSGWIAGMIKYFKLLPS